jgi:hypothetical protein
VNRIRCTFARINQRSIERASIYERHHSSAR